MHRPLLARWLGIVLRALHLASVILLGAALMAEHQTATPIDAVMISGIALFALDTWSYPGHLFEVAGVSVVLKLILIAAMAIDPAWQLPLFWVVVVWSVLFSHAPASLRHHRLRGSR